MKMNEYVKTKIDEAEIVSFDVFDTLIKRLVNRPEDIFVLTGKKLGIAGYEKFRTDSQREISMKVEREYHQAHADYDQIYQYMEEKEPELVDWAVAKNTEFEMELRSVAANPEMYAVYQYALQQGKKVIAVSDMYLMEEHITKMLEKCGYHELHHVYVSANVNYTKYRGDIFNYVSKAENVLPQQFFHIGDNKASDYVNAEAAGWNAWWYQTPMMEKEKKYNLHSEVDFGAATLAMLQNNSFWHNLGAYVGGPLYTGIEQWFVEKMDREEACNIFLLARDGYNLHQILQKNYDRKVRYLYLSRRSMVFAGVTELDAETLELLPPYTIGQTIDEIIEYFELPETFRKSVSKAGFRSVEERINNVEDMEKFKKLYQICSETFMEKCRKDRIAAGRYLEANGFFEGPARVFDCGWNGSSQVLLQRVVDALEKTVDIKFYYIGILDTVKSKKQLRGKKYETYLFDHSTNYNVQTAIKKAIVVFELFFGAPQESVLKYENETPVFEMTGVDLKIKEEICSGIMDYIQVSREFVEYAKIVITPELATAPVFRLIDSPTQEEAQMIGNVMNVDSFAMQKGVKKYIARITEQEYLNNKNTEIYWPQGLFKRNDIDTALKEMIAKDRNLAYSPEEEKDSEETVSVSKDENYNIWIREHEKQNGETEKLKYNPKFSVVIPVYNVLDSQLGACIESVLGQTYENWELILVDDCSSWESVRTFLKRYEGRDGVHIIYRTENGHISKATNDGIQAAAGDYIAFSDCDDVLAKNALYEMARKLNENPEYDFVYSDEDKLTEDGQYRHSPFFKPDWSPDTFMSLMYTNHLAVYRTELVKKTGGLRTEYNGAQDYDFTLRFMEQSANNRVGHVPKVLYHWRERPESIASQMEAKPYALEAMKNLKYDMLRRRGLTGEVCFVGDMYQYRIVYTNQEKPLISIVIPSKDNFNVLKQCIDSILAKTAYDRYEIVIVDNGSNDHNKGEIEKYAEENGMIYLYQKAAFNYSSMCNMGVNASKGEYIVLLNDDTEVIQENWLDILLGQASQEHTGAVGVKLFYPESNVIQHAGIINQEIGPSHALMGGSDSVTYYFGRNRVDYNYIAVTAACMMVKKSRYIEVEGLDENLPVAYNDVDFCFNLYEAGYYNIIRNDVTLYHHESISRGKDVEPEKQQRLMIEKNYLYRKHPGLKGKDPFYNCNLTQYKGDYSIDMEARIPETQVKKHAENIFRKKTNTILCSLDSVSENVEIVIEGWIMASAKHEEQAKRFVILESETGETFQIPLNRSYRADVKQHLGLQDGAIGFCVRIPRKMLDLGRTSYRIGFYVITRHGLKKKYCDTDYVIHKKKAIEVSESVSEVTISPEAAIQVAAAIDEKIKLEKVTYIRGWIRNLRNGNQLFDKYLIVEEDGRERLYSLESEYRYDLEREIPSISYMGCSGFRCYVPNEKKVIGFYMRNHITGEVMRGNL